MMGPDLYSAEMMLRRQLERLHGRDDRELYYAQQERRREERRREYSPARPLRVLRRLLAQL